MALRPGMIVSNEPGYYRTGAYGIRIENLVAVQDVPTPPGGERKVMGFETLTLVQCKKARPLPIVLFGSSHWKRLINLDVLVEEGAISPEDLKLFTYVDDAEEAWAVIKAFYRL